MKLTKYGHACFTVEKDGKLLVVDPGGWTTDLGSPENVVGIVVTHQHQDHFDVNAIGAIIAHNPEARVIAHESMTKQLGDAILTIAVVPSEGIEVGPFKLEFYGGEHAVIHPSMPTAVNLAVMINGKIYHPGDSFTQPEVLVDTLAVPVGGPWMKAAESLDFVTAIKPRFAFPTHDAVLSDAGKSLADMLTSQFAEKVGTTYQRLTEPMEIAEE